jgi:hypothetical protein
MLQRRINERLCPLSLRNISLYCKGPYALRFRERYSFDRGVFGG